MFFNNILDDNVYLLHKIGDFEI